MTLLVYRRGQNVFPRSSGKIRLCYINFGLMESKTKLFSYDFLNKVIIEIDTSAQHMFSGNAEVPVLQIFRFIYLIVLKPYNFFCFSCKHFFKSYCCQILKLFFQVSCKIVNVFDM